MESKASISGLGSEGMRLARLDRFRMWWESRVRGFAVKWLTALSFLAFYYIFTLCTNPGRTGEAKAELENIYKKLIAQLLATDI